MSLAIVCRVSWVCGGVKGSQHEGLWEVRSLLVFWIQMLWRRGQNFLSGKGDGLTGSSVETFLEQLAQSATQIHTSKQTHTYSICNDDVTDFFVRRMLYDTIILSKHYPCASGTRR